MKKAIKWVLLIAVVLVLVLIWSAMAITDYTRSKDLKPPIFATSINLDQHGAGIYHCIGYDVDAYSKAFNGKDHIVYDMRFRLFGRGDDRRRTLSDNYHQNYGLLCLDKETVLNYFEGLEVVEPDISGKQETYTEYVDGNDVKVMNLVLYNPPFGIDWKREKAEVEAEAKKGFEGRFGPGLPAISDGQMLFMLNGVKKLKEGSGRMAIIQNGSSLFTGDAGSGASEIRKYVIDGDLVEAIIQLPTDLFYNTGISTYIWVLSKGKEMKRSGKVQLIDASKCFVKRRKNIGNKRVDLNDNCIALIIKAYESFEDGVFEDGDLNVESKIFDNDYFGFTKVSVETPLCDESGKPILKKGKMQPDKSKSDNEIIPLQDDIDEYMKKNVLPYNPLAFLDRSKDKIGYEVPFTKLFYVFEEQTPSSTIFEEIKTLEAEETRLMNELFH